MKAGYRNPTLLVMVFSWKGTCTPSDPQVPKHGGDPAIIIARTVATDPSGKTFVGSLRRATPLYAALANRFGGRDVVKRERPQLMASAVPR